MEVQSIRNPKKIKALCAVLKDQHPKYYIMFLIGLQSGLRVSDILPLRVSDINSLCSSKVKERKTKKRRFLYLNAPTEKEIRDYIAAERLKEDDYLIYSRKHAPDGTRKPIDRVQAYRVLREAGEACGIERVGTHTMRKTFGYHYYKLTHDIASLMQIFNHSSPAITLKYIGITDEELRNSLENFVLFK